MRCLYIAARAPLSPHYRGGSSAIYYEQLASLHDLGHEVHLWHFAYEKERQSYDAFVAGDAAVWAEVQAMCASITITTLPQRPNLWQKVQDRLANRLSGQDAIFPLLRTVAHAEFKRLLRQTRPDFIFAQHLWPAQVAVLQKEVPVIFSHHDWLFRIKALRSRQAESEAMRQMEERVARQAAAVTSGSAVECQQLRDIGCANVAYIPVAYKPAELDLDTLPDEPRLVHFGGLATTATRVGLERFAALVWPHIRPKPLFYAVGDISSAALSPTLPQFLSEVVCTGHVTDWPTVLRPYDLHLIPWEHSTGQRTRLPVAFNFGQVVVAARPGIAGYPEAQDGLNCRLVDRLEEMAPVISELLADPAQRLRLGRAARETFMDSFTRPGLLPRYQTLIERVTRSS